MPRKKDEKKTTVKKTPAKTRKTVSPKTKQSESSSVSETKNRSFTDRVRNIRLTRAQVFLIAGIVAFIAFLYLLQGFFVSATVNNWPITRLHLIQELEKQYGAQVLDTLVTKKIIEQKSAEQGVSVSDEEVNKEIEQIESRLKESGQTLEQVLTFQGMTREDLEENLHLQKMVEKLAAGEVKVTDQEVSQYIEQNSEALPEGQPEKELRENVRETLLQQKKTESIQSWLQKVRQDSEIRYFNDELRPQS